MPYHPINAETPNNNLPILKSFPNPSNPSSQTLRPLDSGFRRNDVGCEGSFASFQSWFKNPSCQCYYLPT